MKIPNYAGHTETQSIFALSGGNNDGLLYRGHHFNKLIGSIWCMGPEDGNDHK